MTKWLIDGTTEVPSLFERIKAIFRPQPQYFILEFDDNEQTIIMHAGLSLRKLQHILRNNTSDLKHIQTKADVDRLVQQSKV